MIFAFASGIMCFNYSNFRFSSHTAITCAVHYTHHQISVHVHHKSFQEMHAFLNSENLRVDSRTTDKLEVKLELESPLVNTQIFKAQTLLLLRSSCRPPRHVKPELKLPTPLHLFTNNHKNRHAQ